MKWLLGWLWWLPSLLLADGMEAFLRRAAELQDPLANRAADFLVTHMPAGDRSTLKDDFLMEHLTLALEARRRFPWSAAVPEEVFFNDVLPYACLDEPRELWRRRLVEVCAPIVANAHTASEAAQAINRNVFNALQVHYHNGRKRPNQGLLESMASGKASCTGLSLLLVGACRSVGIPARVVGTPMWVNRTGNHTWVEIWDGGWHFTGADEASPDGLNHGWFVENAAAAVDDPPEHGIYASSWQPRDAVFPLVWNPEARWVPAERVTHRYVARNTPSETKTTTPMSSIGVRWFDARGDRVQLTVRVFAADGTMLASGLTRSGRADWNDMPVFKLPVGCVGWLESQSSPDPACVPFGPLDAAFHAIDAGKGTAPSRAVLELVAWFKLSNEQSKADHPALRLPLSREEAMWAAAALTAKVAGNQKSAREAELRSRQVKFKGKVMRWHETTFGNAPADGRSLWISLHGGGNAPPEVNDSQWENQARLYQPKEGIYLAPRAPTDTWNLWHEEHVDPMLQRIIEDCVQLRDVNPEKVFLLGYSAGGDGVWQLAPRMADRFAAAAMMAGHPNEARLDNLAHLPFAILMGADDAAYQRNEVAAAKAAELKTRSESQPGSYVHLFRLYPHTGHWMKLQDAEALPWMEPFRRQSWPRSLVWTQDDVIHRRFYWLKLPASHPTKPGDSIRAEVHGQEIALTGVVPTGTEIRLNDRLLDLDQPLRVTVNGKEEFQGRVTRRAEVILKSLRERYDPAAIATSAIVIP